MEVVVWQNFSSLLLTSQAANYRVWRHLRDMRVSFSPDAAEIAGECFRPPPLARYYRPLLNIYAVSESSFSLRRADRYGSL